jgi:hypothetical protein
MLTADRWQLLLEACLLGLISVVICVAISWLLGVEETRDFVTKLSVRIRNQRPKSVSA